MKIGRYGNIMQFSTQPPAKKKFELLAFFPAHDAFISVGVELHFTRTPEGVGGILVTA
jgi:hypothetical protein